MEVVLVFLSRDFFLSATPHSENRPVSGVWGGLGWDVWSLWFTEAEASVERS